MKNRSSVMVKVGQLNQLKKTIFKRYVLIKNNATCTPKHKSSLFFRSLFCKRN